MVKRRPPRARPLALAALTLVVGLWNGLAGSGRLLPVAAVIAVAAALAALLLDERVLLIIATSVSIAAGGMVIGSAAQRVSQRDCRLLWESGTRVVVSGIAVGYLPAGEQGGVRLRPIDASRDTGCAWAGPIRVYADRVMEPGVTYTVMGAWQPARTPGNAPRAPERRGWIAATKISRVSGARFWRTPFLATRGWLAVKLWSVYPRRWAPLAEALVLGQRETLSRETTQRIARAGLAHLLAISGLHVGMLAAAFFGLMRVARLRLLQAHVATVVVTFAYVVLIGAPASAVRAALMVAIWTLTRMAGRASSAYDVLGLAAILLLLARPWSVTEPGFQLSFAGAAAVGYAHTETRRSVWMRGSSPLLRGITSSLLVSTAAVLLTAPITAIHFGRVAPAALLGNLVAVPLLALAMPALFMSALLSAWPALAAWPAGAAVLLLRAVDAVARVLSSLRWGSLDVANPGLLAALGYAVLLVLGAHALHGAWQRRRFILALGMVSAAAIAWPPLRAAIAPNDLAVYVLDVGQGDGIAIATPSRHWLLVDAGPNINGFDAGERRVLPFFREQGARRLEAWLASHPDLDHVGGAPSVFDAMNVRRVIGSGRITGQVGQIAVLRWLAKSERPWLHARAGSSLTVDGVELVFLHPERDPSTDLESPNDISLVFLLKYGEFRMLFTGDVSSDVEDGLSRQLSDSLRVHVLKVSHHGSHTSTSPLFLETTRPELAIISVGRGNRYGHPSPRVLWRLNSSQIPVRRTDRDGTVVIEAKRDGSWQVRSAAEGY